MVALTICIFACASRKQFPNQSVFIKTVSIKSSDIRSMFLIVLRRVCLSSLYMGQRRTYREVDSTSKPQLEIGFNVS